MCRNRSMIEAVTCQFVASRNHFRKKVAVMTGCNTQDEERGPGINLVEHIQQVTYLSNERSRAAVPSRVVKTPRRQLVPVLKVNPQENRWDWSRPSRVRPGVLSDSHDRGRTVTDTG